MEGNDGQTRDARGPIACNDGAFGQETQRARLFTMSLEASTNAGVSRLGQTLSWAKTRMDTGFFGATPTLFPRLRLSFAS